MCKLIEILDYNNVSGCYIMRPWFFFFFFTDAIHFWFDAKIKWVSRMHMFQCQKYLKNKRITSSSLVKKAGSSNLEEPVAIRPTSEMVVYPYYARWVRSHRDLSLINQWNSVIRLEFKHPMPFLRIREFLWQEGHTTFLTKKEAMNEVYGVIDLYRCVYQEVFRSSVAMGIKSENEKNFPAVTLHQPLKVSFLRQVLEYKLVIVWDRISAI